MGGKRAALQPATVKPASNTFGLALSLLAGKTDLISFWPEECYQARTLSGRVLNQRYFLCNATDAVRRVLSDNHDNYDRKSPLQRYWLEPLIDDGLFVSDGELWRRRRRLCAPIFKKERLHRYVPLMAQTAAEVGARWSRIPIGQSVDMLNEMALLTSRIIARSVFGEDVTDTEAAKVVDGFARYQAVAESLDFSLLSGLPLLRWLRWRDRAREVRHHAATMHEVIDNIVERQAKEGTSSDSFVSLFRQGEARHPDDLHMGDHGARNEAIVMFMAGHETTANTLAWTWYLLSGCRYSRERLSAELKNVLDGRAPTLDDLPKLVFTRAVIEEAMRLYPPVPVMARQARNRDEIRGKEIHPGTIMVVAPWLLHRHRKCWDDPDDFRPERFLPPNPRPDNYQYIPFSAGHRVCLGISFALMETMICVATLAQQFDPEILPGHEVELDCDLTLRPKGGLPMLMRRPASA